MKSLLEYLRGTPRPVDEQPGIRRAEKLRHAVALAKADGAETAKNRALSEIRQLEAEIRRKHR
jgi:hypothetical protein